MESNTTTIPASAGAAFESSGYCWQKTDLANNSLPLWPNPLLSKGLHPDDLYLFAFQELPFPWKQRGLLAHLAKTIARRVIGFLGPGTFAATSEGNCTLDRRIQPRDSPESCTYSQAGSVSRIWNSSFASASRTTADVSTTVRKRGWRLLHLTACHSRRDENLGKSVAGAHRSVNSDSCRLEADLRPSNTVLPPSEAEILRSCAIVAWKSA